MAQLVAIHELTLKDGVSPEDFERFLDGDALAPWRVSGVTASVV